MTDLFLLIILAGTLSGLVALIKQAPARDIRDEIRQIHHLLILGRKDAVEENARRITKGDRARRVRELIGPPDSFQNGDWLYFSDEHSGYRISFSSGKRVDVVDHWIS